jgi:hypothetical protein
VTKPREDLGTLVGNNPPDESHQAPIDVVAQARAVKLLEVLERVTQLTMQGLLAWREERSASTTRFLTTGTFGRQGAVDIEIECTGGLDQAIVPALFRVRASFTAACVEQRASGTLRHRLKQLIDVIELRERKRAEQRALGELEWLTKIAEVAIR